MRPGPAADALLRRTLDALRAAEPGARWVRSGRSHLTLAFLGETDAAGAERATEAMRAAAGTGGPFGLAFGGAGAFPSWDAPRVLWLGLASGCPQIAALEAALRPGLERLGFALEDRPFQPHLTLARLGAGFARDREKVSVLRGELGRLAAPALWRAAAARASALELIESRLTPAGPVHSMLHRVELTG